MTNSNPSPPINFNYSTCGNRCSTPESVPTVINCKRWATDPDVQAHVKEAYRMWRMGEIDSEMLAFYRLCDRQGKKIDDLPRGVSVSTLFNPQETKSPNAVKGTYRAQFMASNDSEYDATIETLEVMDCPEARSRINHLDNCRRFAYFARCQVTGDVRVMSDSCRQRWCPMCAKQKAKYARESTLEYIQGLKRPRFLTLTLRNEPGDLATQLSFLRDCFRRLRQRVYWKTNVTGGIFFLQVKRGKNSGYWHPHFHILIDGNYLEQKRISKLWELVSYGSPVIDIQAISDLGKAADYVARYSSRPAMLEDMPVDDRIEVMTALHGKRLSGTFGNAKCVTLTPPKIKDDHEWQQLGWYDKVVSDSTTNANALAIINAWKHETALDEGVFVEYTHRHDKFEFTPEIKKKQKQMYMDFFNSC